MEIRDFDYNLFKGPLIDVEIRPPANALPEKHFSKFLTILMLIDTGAQGTHVRRSVAQAVGLPEDNPAEGLTLDGQRVSLDGYIGDLYFPAFRTGLIGRRLLEYRSLNDRYDGVIGRDILSQCLLHFEPNKLKFTLGLPMNNDANFEP